MTATAGLFSSTTLEEILCDVWSAYLSTFEAPTPSSEPGGAELVGSVRVSGAWQGAVDLALSAPTARLAAAAMLALPDEELDDQDVRDAVGELANIVGGNVKSLLPAPTTLSLPELVPGRHGPPALGVRLLAEATLGGVGVPIVARVWEGAPAGLR